jgi:Uma2 family endonuclease
MIVESIPEVEAPPAERLWTVADLAALPDELPTGPVHYELDDGRLIIMAPPGDTRGAVESNLVTQLKVQGELRGHGKARCGEVTVILRRNPDRTVGADAVFVANANLPIRLSKENFLETLPDLVVEVRSKNDRIAAMERKAGEYLTAGTRVVWLVDPFRQTVTELRLNQAPKVYAASDTLTIDDVIPGFQMAVADVFRT